MSHTAKTPSAASGEEGTDARVRRRLGAVFRIEAARLVAAVLRIVRDVGTAEEIAQDAYLIALEAWSKDDDDAIPDNPAAWLMTTARNRALNHVHRARMLANKHALLTHDNDEQQQPDMDDAREFNEAGGDDLLRLVFIACHPILSMEARIALTLRLLCGLTTHEIARAFLAPEPTIQQRIVRAKKMLVGVPFEMPRNDELRERLAAVLHVVYLVFNEGYSATAGEDWVRPELCQDALRLGRTITTLVPDESEAHGLLALMEIQASRLAARVGPNGEPIPLLEQDRSKWDHLLIHRGLTALERATQTLKQPRGPYLLQAAIAASYVTGEINWQGIADLYAELAAQLPSPIVELNRAVVIGKAQGAEAGLRHTDALVDQLRDYHLLPTVRADFLITLGRRDEARRELERAIALARNSREKDLLTERLMKISAAD